MRLSLFFAAAPYVVAGCANGGDEGMLVLKDVVPSTGCMFLSQPTEPYITAGEVSIFAGGYEFAPQLESRIVAPADDNGLDRTIITTGVNVNLTFADSTVESELNLTSDLTHFNVPMSVAVSPVLGGTTTSVADGEFQLIPEGVFTAMQDTPAIVDDFAFSTLIIANFQVLGTMDGGQVTSQEFNFGVTACGLESCVTQVAGPGSEALCPLPPGTIVADGTNSCPGLQDTLVTCCIQPIDTGSGTVDELLCGSDAPVSSGSGSGSGSN
jgi:hypothetical protein